MKTIKLRIDELNHPEKNIRKHSHKQINEMKRSIDMFGQFRPVVVDENNTILAGNGLVTAMREMGIQTVDVLKYDNLTEAQKKKLMIADNQIASLGTDDMSVLEEFIKELDGDLDVPGYDTEALEMLVAESSAVTEEVLSYGVFPTEEIESFRERSQEPVQPVVQTYHEPVQTSTPIHSETVNQTYQQPINASVTRPETQREELSYESAPMENVRYVICPHCGEKIRVE